MRVRGVPDSPEHNCPEVLGETYFRLASCVHHVRLDTSVNRSDRSDSIESASPKLFPCLAMFFLSDPPSRSDIGDIILEKSLFVKFFLNKKFPERRSYTGFDPNCWKSHRIFCPLLPRIWRRISIVSPLPPPACGGQIDVDAVGVADRPFPNQNNLAV